MAPDVRVIALARGMVYPTILFDSTVPLTGATTFISGAKIGQKYGWACDTFFRVVVEERMDN